MAELPTDASVEVATVAPARSGGTAWPRLLAGVAALLVIAAVLVLLPRLSARRSAGTGLGALDARAPVLDEPVPNFALQDMAGKIVRLSDLRGQIVFVNFWATWCVPCREELPIIQQIYGEQRGNGFAVLEVNEQEAPADVAAFARAIGEMPPIVFDRDGSVMAQYRLKGLPDSFTIDRQGIVRGLSYGPVSRQTMLKYIETARQAGP